MNEKLKKYQDLMSGLMQKLDAERQRASRLEHELSQYREGKSLADQLAEKDDIINRQKQTIDKLNAQLDKLKRKVWGHSSEKRSSSYDPAQLTFDFGELSVSPEEEEAYRKVHEGLDAYHQQRKDAAEKRRSENQPSRRPIPDSIRREHIDIYPEGYNEEEWELLPDKLCERKAVLHRKPAEYVAIEYVRHKAVRKDDIERTIRCATAPQTPIAKSYANSTVLANLMVGKFVDSLPFDRQIEMMKRFGMDFPPATVSDWFMDVADLLRPLYYRIRDLVMETDHIQADETTVSIVDDEKHRTVKGHLWQICAVTRKLLFFHYDKGSRSKEVTLGMFAHFRGGRSRLTDMPCTTIMKARTGSYSLTAGPIRDAGSTGA